MEFDPLLFGAVIGCILIGTLIGFCLARKTGCSPVGTLEDPLGDAPSSPPSEASPSPSESPAQGATETAPAQSSWRSGSDSELCQFMLGVIDSIDEMELKKRRLPASEQAIVLAMQERLCDLIGLAEGEVIQETVWRPELQRAVSISPGSSDQKDTQIITSIQSGLRHRGRIIRKQDVHISKPQS